MTSAYDYELFVRTAFGLVAGKLINRIEDPAEFADTDTFSDDNLSTVKAATGYAMGIVSKNIRNKDMETHEAMDVYLDRVMAAVNVNDIAGTIHDFNQNVVEKYFDRVEGVLRPK